jgi:hypothetical protein
MAKRAVTKVSSVTKPINRRSLLSRALPGSRATVRATDLGLELLQRFPPYVATLCKMNDLDRSPKGEAQKAARIEAFERIGEIAQAIVVRPATDAAHLVDLAIVARWEYDTNYPTSHGAECRMVDFFLKLGGVAEVDCDMEAIAARYMG